MSVIVQEFLVGALDYNYGNVSDESTGGQVKLREGDLIEYNSLTTPGNGAAPVASSGNGPSTSAATSAAKSSPGPLQAFLKLALQREGTPWSASLALGSNSAGTAA